MIREEKTTERKTRSDGGLEDRREAAAVSMETKNTVSSDLNHFIRRHTHERTNQSETVDQVGENRLLISGVEHDKKQERKQSVLLSPPTGRGLHHTPKNQ